MQEHKASALLGRLLCGFNNKIKYSLQSWQWQCLSQ